MKNLFNYSFAAFLLLILTSLISCSGSAKKEVLTSKIQYDVPVSNNNPQLDWWVNNLEGSKREPFLKRIMEAAENGEVRVFDYFNNPLNPEQVKSMGTDTVYQTLMRTYPPYEEYDTVIIRSVSYRDIVKIRFMEEWAWDTKTLEIEKKILAIGPVTQKEIAGESFTQLLFWISLDEGFPGK
jgi:hypothetical protein